MTLGDALILVLALLGLLRVLTYPSLSRRVRTLLAAGLVLRIVGGQLYFVVGEVVYGGTADYWTYYHHGALYAKAVLAGTPEASGSFWLARGEWCCTTFTIKASGLVSAVLSPSVFGSFVLFSLVGYVGAVAFVVAFWRAFPSMRREAYLAWLMLFPSLWFWPAALGKDALMIAGIGIAVLGYVGSRGKANLLVLASGAALVAAVRPQVAVVLLFAFAAGYLLLVRRGDTFSEVVQGAMIAAVGIGALFLAQSALGITFTDTGEVMNYLEGRQMAVSQMGGSSVNTEGGGWSGVIMAPINVLMRPFLWEAGSVTALIAALEITAVWVMGWRRRREIAHFLWAYRRNRVLLMVAAFLVVYAVALGMGAGNMGIIARQRIHLFPFAFVFFAGLADMPRWAPRRAVYAAPGARPAVGAS